MKSRLVILSTILATTAGLGASGAAFANPIDAQAHAAALLNPATLSAGNVSSQTAVGDAQAQAAALLSGLRTGQEASAQEPAQANRGSLDAQAHAAALLSGSRVSVIDDQRISATNESLGDHPAVIVARTPKARGIDPNTFIVAHPARLELLAASPNANVSERAQVQARSSKEVAKSVASGVAGR